MISLGLGCTRLLSSDTYRKDYQINFTQITQLIVVSRVLLCSNAPAVELG